MKLRTLILFLVAVEIALMALTSIKLLAEWEGPLSPQLTEQNILTGKIQHLFLANAMWSRFPSAPTHMMACVDVRALAIMLPFAAILFTLHRRRRISLTAAGYFLLLSSAVPWVLGQLLLRQNPQLELAGQWMTTMLTSLLYASVGCIAFCATEAIAAHRAAPKSLAQDKPQAA